MYTFGWFSTGRDEAACELLKEAWHSIQDGTIPARIGFVFCNREPGEATESDRFIQLVKDLSIPLYALSSRRFNPTLKRENLGFWRKGFHDRVEETLEGEKIDTIVLAGYMLIVNPETCRRLPMINLHPAEPGGPKGTWQEVIWQLIARGAERTGVMMHLVTETLDEGPPITYCTFPLKGGAFDPMWVEMGAKLGFMSLGEIIHDEGEKNRLFQEIREQGVLREIPLLLMTMKALAQGRVRIQGERILDHRGEEIGSLCLNRDVEAHIELSGQNASI
jgi:phosphoribosylglycinamide formyltransferase-1